MEQAALTHCLELLDEALCLAQTLGNHIDELTQYWAAKELLAPALS